MIANHLDSDSATFLLSRLLENGGFCTIQLTAAALDVTPLLARKILADLISTDYLRRVFLLRSRDATNYFQITLRAGKLFGRPHPNAARSSPSDSQILRGIARFWFSVQPQFRDKIVGESISFAAFHAAGLSIPAGWPCGDTAVESENKSLAIYSFPAINQTLEVAVKSTFLRYADQLDRLKIGFVIEARRAENLREILAEIAGTAIDQKTGITSGLLDLDQLMEQFSTATALQKVALQAQITNFMLPLPGHNLATLNPLATAILPVVLHSLF